MKHIFICLMTAAILLPSFAAAQQNTKPAAAHPDLSGVWAFGIDLPPGGLKRTLNGSAPIKTVDQSARRPAKGPVAGALPSTPAPSYKPELLAKVKNLSDNESKTDQVFYCGRPGVPRIGSPRKILQLPNGVVFFYGDLSRAR